MLERAAEQTVAPEGMLYDDSENSNVRKLVVEAYDDPKREGDIQRSESTSLDGYIYRRALLDQNGLFCRPAPFPLRKLPKSRVHSKSAVCVCMYMSGFGETCMLKEYKDLRSWGCVG